MNTKTESSSGCEVFCHFVGNNSTRSVRLKNGMGGGRQQEILIDKEKFHSPISPYKYYRNEKIFPRAYVYLYWQVFGRVQRQK